MRKVRNDLRQRHKELLAKQAARADAEREAERIRVARSAAETRFSELTAKMQAESVSAMLENRRPPEPDPSLAEQLRALKIQREAASGALPAAINNVGVAVEAVKSAKAAFNTSGLLYVASIQEETAGAIRSVIAQLSPLIARLKAIDILRADVVDGAFVHRSGTLPALWSGSVVATNLCNGVGEQLRPAELNPEHLAQLAQSALSELKTQYEKELS